MKTFDVRVGPYIKDKNSTSKIMLNVLIALIPIVVFSFYKNGYVPYSHGYGSIYDLFYPLIFVLIGAFASFALETIYALIFLRKKYNKFSYYLKSTYSFMPGLFMALVLPLSTPIPVLLLGIFVSVIIGKMVFGGFAQNIFNPALLGVLFIMICFSASISSYANPYEVDTIASSTPLTNEAILRDSNQIVNEVTLTKPYGGLLNFFVGFIPGAVGEVSSLLIIVGFIYLAITKSIKWKIPTAYILTVLGMTFVIGLLNGVGLSYSVYQVLSGGLLFGAVFMATDPVTSPTTSLGQIIYGFGLGILTVLIRFLLPYPEGVLISILFMNMLVFIIDRLGAMARYNHYIRTIVITLLIVIMGLLSLYIGKNSERDKTVDSNFSVNEREEKGSITNYTVSQKHKYGTLKAKIKIDNGKIVDVYIISPNDTYTNNVKNGDYVKKLISGQNNLTDVDTVAGATYTSTALKTLLINVLNDYNGPKKEIDKEEKDFVVISKETNDLETIYLVEIEGYMDKIKIEFVVSEDKISSAKILEHDENEYVNLIIDANYLVSLISKQDNLDEVDTVAGATYTSTYLKDAFVKLLEEHMGALNEKV